MAGTAAVLAFPIGSTQLSVAGLTPTNHSVGTSPSSTVPTTHAPSKTTSSTATTLPTTNTTGPTTTPTSGAESATGADETFHYGRIAVTVTIDGGKITNVTIANISEPDPRSASIDAYAVPKLEQQVLDADSANIDGI